MDVRKKLHEARLYLILDTQVRPYRRLLEIARKAVAGGVDMVQLRDKQGNARDILAFSSEIKKILKNRILYVVNDRVDLAVLSGADGVHVGQEDVPLPQARWLMRPGKIIGVSCQTAEHVRQAQRQGADYIGLGSVFKTKTKPGRLPMDPRRLMQFSKKMVVPFFAIGGISHRNIRKVLDAGVTRVAVCRDICLAQDAKAAALRIKKELKDIENLRG